MFTAEERREYIGGSDIAAVMGMNRWKTSLTLWLLLQKSFLKRQA